MKKEIYYSFIHFPAMNPVDVVKVVVSLLFSNGGIVVSDVVGGGVTVVDVIDGSVVVGVITVVVEVVVVEVVGGGPHQSCVQRSSYLHLGHTSRLQRARLRVVMSLQS